MFLILFATLLSALSVSTAQIPLNSWPHNYTDIPSGAYSPKWQNYFEVKDPLPNVTVPLPRSFAGSISTNRPGHGNNSLFFWGFEKEHGSLTAAANERSNDPYLIWLNGGPGSSSMLGLFLENGPLHMNQDYSIVPNNFSWNRQVDSFWIDQPVGTGFSTAESVGGYVKDEDQMAEDFLGFLSNLVQVFPSLATRPLYLTGESYAGQFIPYITKAIFSSPEPPVKLRKIAMGNAASGSFAAYEEVSAVTVLETYPQIIDFNTDVFNYFRTQEHLCKYDLNLTYPQNGYFPTLIDPRQTVSADSPFFPSSASKAKTSFRRAITQQYAKRNSKTGLTARAIIKREEERQRWTRDLTNRPNGTLDPWYGCFLWEELTDYAVNFTFPWTNGLFNPYFAPDALNPETLPDPGNFLNDNRVRRALHAPTSRNFTAQINYPFGSTYNFTPGSNVFGDPSPEAMLFFSELATNATKHGVSIIITSGNDDTLVAHRSSEVVIQNMTFQGIQGFTRKPSTPWFGNDGSLAGIVHQERNVTYALFLRAGHQIPMYQPANAATFLREFILGSNMTGLLVPNSTTVIGGEDPQLAGDIVPGNSAIFYGSATTASSSIAPSATFASWASFLATATVVPKPTSLV
ncbi:hypothetical protein PILCRDRAFT_823685 [Piloderma croceum F 1598]|uniref:Carboxypeptidase n=1 Tax=Piloderma croceum (strain F 1598) TaxID=765440 RepID=A0A0C3FH42_PILCF|nr:hypothetical protein PILCRDRAFT_823685 [Piloderma croceum F 1598]